MTAGRQRAYNARLQRFDPLLRIHWSPRRACALLERRATYKRISIDPELYGREEHDTVRQMRDGYHEIGAYPQGELPSVERLIAYLESQDVWKRGDQDFARLAEAVADELDAAYEARVKAAEQYHTDDVGDRVGDLYDHFHRPQFVVPRSLPG